MGRVSLYICSHLLQQTLSAALAHSEACQAQPGEAGTYTCSYHSHPTSVLYSRKATKVSFLLPL